jgi:hypothetical protein
VLLKKFGEIRIGIRMVFTEIVRNLKPETGRDFTGFQILFDAGVASFRMIERMIFAVCDFAGTEMLIHNFPPGAYL